MFNSLAYELIGLSQSLTLYDLFGRFPADRGQQGGGQLCAVGPGRRPVLGEGEYRQVQWRP